MSREISRRSALAGIGLAGLSLGSVVTACSRGTNRAARQRTITFITDVAPYGKHAPFYVAKERGWRDRGLDVAIQAGNGSSDAITKLAAGAGEFAFADASAVIVARGNNGAKIHLIAMYHYRNLMAELTLADRPIRRPRDLEGTRQQCTAGDGDLLLLPALAQINGFDASKVNVLIGQFTSAVQNVISGQVDGTLAYYTLFPALDAAAKASGKSASAFLYADYGLDLYNNGIVTRDELLRSDPSTVRAFVDGFVEAVLFSVRDPQKAVSILHKNVPGIDEGIARAQLQVAITHLNVPEVREQGFGPMSEEKMRLTLSLVNKHFSLRAPVNNVEEVFTNDFSPKGMIPKFS